MNIYLFSIFVILFLIYLYRRYKQLVLDLSRLPPLVKGVHLFRGHFDLLNFKRLHLSLTEIGASQSHVFSLSIYGQLVVVLNSRESILDVLCSKTLECAARPTPFLVHFWTRNRRDLMFAEPEAKWSMARKMFHKFFVDMKRIHDRREFSEIVFGEKWYDGLYMVLSKQHGKTINLSAIIHTFQTSLMATMLFGAEVAEDLELLTEISGLTNDASEVIESLCKRMLNGEPWEGLFGSGTFGNVCNLMNKQKLVLKKIEECKLKQSTKHSCRSSDVSVCISSMDDLFQASRNLFEENHANNILMELLYASVDPIISLVHSFVYQLCSQPSLQEKIYSQLHDLTPCMLALESRASLPLVEACVYELLRFKSPLPLGIFRRTLGPFTLVNFNSTVIPKHAVVVANLWKMHHDESVYAKAHEFRPERFLNDEGHLSESMVRSLFVFGAGKRICPGKRVVFDLLFMYVGNLVREFKFRFERENSPLSGIVCERRIVTSVDECDDRRKSESEIKTLCTDRDSLLKCIQDGDDLVYDDDNCS